MLPYTAEEIEWLSARPPRAADATGGSPPDPDSPDREGVMRTLGRPAPAH